MSGKGGVGGRAGGKQGWCTLVSKADFFYFHNFLCFFSLGYEQFVVKIYGSIKID